MLGEKEKMGIRKEKKEENRRRKKIHSIVEFNRRYIKLSMFLPRSSHITCLEKQVRIIDEFVCLVDTSSIGEAIDFLHSVYFIVETRI